MPRKEKIARGLPLRHSKSLSFSATPSPPQEDESSDSDSSPGTNIPDKVAGFKIESLLGEGAYGRVYKAISPNNQRVVALKLIHVSREEESDVFYLQREIAIHQMLRHLNIVRSYQAFIIDENSVAMELEFISGKELFDTIIENGFLSEYSCRNLFRQIVSAVGYLQTFFIIHRDLKPENIMVTFDGVVKLMDFGFANLLDTNNRLRSWCGTLNYTSPEILNQESYSGPEVDVWSLGVILHTMLTGNMLFGSNDSERVRATQKNLETEELQLPSYLSVAVKDLLRQMIRLDPEERISIWRIAQHPWLRSTEHPDAVDFQLPHQTYPITHIDHQLLNVVKRLTENSDEEDVIFKIRSVDNSREGIAYRLLRRQKKFDLKNQPPITKHGKEMRTYWTNRIVYIFKRINLRK